MATVAPAVADRAVPSTASVPDTAAESAIAPFSVAEKIHVKEAVPPPARSCAAGAGPESIWAPPVPEKVRVGASPLTPTPPESVTDSVTVKTSSRSVVAGAESEAASAEGVRSRMVAEVTDGTESAVPEFASLPEAPAASDSEAGGVPAAVKVQVNTAVLPPGTSTGASAGEALRLADPEVTATVGGFGTGATPFASASPEFVTPKVAVKAWPDAIIAGTVSQRPESCAAACTNTMAQVACTATGVPEIASVPEKLPAKNTAPEEVACAGMWKVREAPAGMSCAGGSVSTTAPPGPETERGPTFTASASTSPWFVTVATRSSD